MIKCPNCGSTLYDMDGFGCDQWGGNMTYREALSVAVGFLDLASGMGFFADGEIELIDAAIEVLYEKGKAFNNET